MTPDQVQELIDALNLKQHDFVLEAVLIAKVKNMEDAGVAVSVSATDDVEWISQLGMLRAAEIVTTQDLRKTLGPRDEEN